LDAPSFFRVVWALSLVRIFHGDTEICLSDEIASQHDGVRAKTPSRKEMNESLRLCGFARLLHEICCVAAGYLKN
jgi:hypothetical protein